MERLFNKKKYFLLLIVTSTLLITYLHYSTLPLIHDLHNIFTELYYLPLLLGALAFGLKGAVLTFIFVSVLYAPYILVNWTNTFPFVANKLLHALFSGLFAVLAGLLVDREKRYRKQSEKDRYLAGLGQAAAAIVHDLKNPVITVLGFAQRIYEGKGDIKTASQAIVESGQRMQKIIHDILDFAKLTQLKLAEENICCIIERANKSCGIKAESKGIKLSMNLSIDPLRVSVDGNKIERALVNLINNAIDASADGQTVTITALPESNYLTIKISDYGSGMDRETLENIFIPFYTQKRSGTGLGMAIAKKIIEEHQGNIHIHSKPGSGTDLTIKLPLNK